MATNVAPLLRVGLDLVGSALTPPDGIVGAYSVPEEGAVGRPCVVVREARST
jgi:hypothetical protein